MAEPAPIAPALKVVLIEDSPLVRDALCALLAEVAGVAVVGGAEDEHTALEVLSLRRPDLAIVDLKLRTGSGIGVLRAMFRNPDHFGRPRTVVFSNHGQGTIRERCRALGVDRFFDKTTDTELLLAYVRQALPS